MSVVENNAHCEQPCQLDKLKQIINLGNLMIKINLEEEKTSKWTKTDFYNQQKRFETILAVLGI